MPTLSHMGLLEGILRQKEISVRVNVLTGEVEDGRGWDWLKEEEWTKRGGDYQEIKPYRQMFATGADQVKFRPHNGGVVFQKVKDVVAPEHGTHGTFYRTLEYHREDSPTE